VGDKPTRTWNVLELDVQPTTEGRELYSEAKTERLFRKILRPSNPSPPQAAAPFPLYSIA